MRKLSQYTSETKKISQENIQTQQATKIIYGSFLERLIALIIDFIILSLVNFILFIIIGFSFGITNSLLQSSSIRAQSLNIVLFILMILLFTIINIFYSIFFLYWKSATPGKMALGLQVIKEDKSKITFWTVILRETIGKIISGSLLNLGYIWMIWDIQKQGWHDKLANTLVIKKQSLPQQ